MLQEVTADLWQWVFSMRIVRGFRLPCRMTLIKLPDGGLCLHSPAKFDEELAQAVSDLGPVKYLIGPNRFHHLFLKPWKERFPEALIAGGSGLAKKRKHLRFDINLDETLPEAWEGALAAQRIAGIPILDETIFLHRPSRTLIVTDFLFNLTKVEGIGTKIITFLVGVNGRPAVGREIKWLTLDKQAAGRSLAQLLNWDFDRVVPAHGDIIATGGKEIFRKAVKGFKVPAF